MGKPLTQNSPCKVGSSPLPTYRLSIWHIVRINPPRSISISSPMKGDTSSPPSAVGHVTLSPSGLRGRVERPWLLLPLLANSWSQKRSPKKDTWNPSQKQGTEPLRQKCMEKGLSGPQEKVDTPSASSPAGMPLLLVSNTCLVISARPLP